MDRSLKNHALFLIVWGVAVGLAPLAGVLDREPVLLRAILTASGVTLVLGGIGVLNRSSWARPLCVGWGAASILVFVGVKGMLGLGFTRVDAAVASSWAIAWTLLEYWKLFRSPIAKQFGDRDAGVIRARD